MLASCILLIISYPKGKVIVSVIDSIDLFHDIALLKSDHFVVFRFHVHASKATSV